MENIPNKNFSHLSNSIIDSIPPIERENILSHAELVNIVYGTSLMSPTDEDPYVYFILSGLVSLIIKLADGPRVEIGVIGNDGLVGWHPSISSQSKTLEYIVQIKGQAYRIKMSALKLLSEKIPTFRSAIVDALYKLFLQVSQSAACNQMHYSHARLAKWMLIATDRSGSPKIMVSHETLSNLLGIRRAGVTVAIGALREKGTVTTGRGWVEITDRESLEKSACKCYAAIKMLSLFPAKTDGA